MDVEHQPPAVSFDSGGVKWVCLEKSILVNSQPDAIDAAFQAVENYPRLFPGTQVIATLDPFPEAGGALHLSYHLGGMTFDMHLTVLERCSRHNVCQTEIRNVQFVSKAVLGGKTSWFWQEEAGSVRLVGRYEYEVQPSMIGYQMERWVLRRLNLDNLERALRNLKRLVETGDLP